MAPQTADVRAAASGGLAPRDTPHAVLHAAILLVALAALGLGWHVFRFVCDDAYIAFRYVGNSVAGFGYTWNPPPFRPVEGYTSFLWVFLLDGTWRLTGLSPPQVAAELGLVCSIGSIVQVWRMARRVPLPAHLAPWRPLGLLLVLAGTLSNRTFLTWTSSGLETPLATFLLLSWVFAAARLSATLRSQLRVCGFAALFALCRPDGLLFVGATGALLLLQGRAFRPLAVLPLGVVGAHLWWRHHTYGFWLPNTWYAKVSRPFLESGWRYLASWLLEYAWWFGVGAVLVAGVAWLLRRERWRYRPWQIAAAAVLAHAGWYTLWVGGDHFEYRIYAHLVPLSWLALLGALGAVGVAPRVFGAVLAGQLAVSLPVPWTHWSATHALTTRGKTLLMTVPVAPLLPEPLASYARPFDALQAWLIPHHVGMRHQEHAVFATHKLSVHPERPPTAEVVAAWASRTAEGADIPVIAATSVGVLGWTLPEVAILDTLGLNDAVVARNPALRGGRNMAHERKPPKDYVSCFSPNAKVVKRSVVVTPREPPLTADGVRRCEDRYWTGGGFDR